MDKKSSHNFLIGLTDFHFIMHKDRNISKTLLTLTSCWSSNYFLVSFGENVLHHITKFLGIFSTRNLYLKAEESKEWKH
jgi:hypothetical protein